LVSPQDIGTAWPAAPRPERVGVELMLLLDVRKSSLLTCSPRRWRVELWRARAPRREGVVAEPSPPRPYSISEVSHRCNPKIAVVCVPSRSNRRARRARRAPLNVGGRRTVSNSYGSAARASVFMVRRAQGPGDSGSAGAGKEGRRKERVGVGNKKKSGGGTFSL